MLDTNTVSQLVRGHPEVASRVVGVPMADLCISCITEGELKFGLAKRPEARRLHVAVAELLKRVEVLPWDSMAAGHYGTLRADLERRGRPLGPLDLLIAAHALAVSAVLVTNDRAFAHATDLALEDWTA